MTLVDKSQQKMQMQSNTLKEYVICIEPVAMKMITILKSRIPCNYRVAAVGKKITYPSSLVMTPQLIMNHRHRTFPVMNQEAKILFG